MIMMTTRFATVFLVLALLMLPQLTALSAANEHGPTREAGLTQSTTPLTGIEQVVASLHTCALTQEGALLCWGANNSRQLGDGTFNHRLLPMRVERLEPKARAVAASRGQTCVLTTEGAVWCWGSNFDGQLGDGTTQGSGWPVMVSGFDRGVAAIDGQEGHFCALTSEGDVWCWGLNNYGQLGDGTTEQRLTPVKVRGLNGGAVAIDVGHYHTCALTNTGGVKCWGQNFAGHLGDGTREDRAEPVDVIGLSQGVNAITAGLNHTCALTDAGAVLCWGGNTSGELGDGTTNGRITPGPVSGMEQGITAISATEQHTCAVTAQGGVVCWGKNNEGQLGDGTTTRRPMPVAVTGLESGIAAVATGRLHTCALTVDGSLRCWGYNESGQLGDGTTTSRLTPVEVVWEEPTSALIYLPLVQR